LARKVLVTVGTRPEAIKLAPVVRRLREDREAFEVVLCATAQHREMLDQVLDVFDLRPDVDLDVMRPGQSPNQVMARVLGEAETLMKRLEPAWVLVQGDTTSALATALAAFHQGIPVAHVEAGLRTGRLDQPFPEEMNRRVIDLVAALRLAPTPRAATALRSEGHTESTIHTTGNTVVDALQIITKKASTVPRENLVLITLHRRESFGEPLERIVEAIGMLASRHAAVRFIHIVHPNPNVRPVVERNASLPNVSLLPPQNYLEMIQWMRRARLILTDSGGIQEEAPSLGTPVLVLREKTERPEAVEGGFARLVGTSPGRILAEASSLLLERPSPIPSPGPNPFGDGRASERIARILSGAIYEPFGAEPCPTAMEYE
jgi:UDP-N-acetylglucosamine 2-epimerase (non-hydrolysing)